MKHKLWSLVGCFLLAGGGSHAQTPAVAPPDWHPAARSLLISTRFAETPQLHLHDYTSYITVEFLRQYLLQ